jgi:hypothetical protein
MGGVGVVQTGHNAIQTLFGIDHTDHYPSINFQTLGPVGHER